MYPKKKVRSIWTAAAHAVVWLIWLERNKRLFENTAAEGNFLGDSRTRIAGVLGKTFVNTRSPLLVIPFFLPFE